MHEAEQAFEEYVERYSRTRRITPEEAKQHQLVKDVKDYYEERYSNKSDGI